MRGKGVFHVISPHTLRITPAYAGKSPTHHLERLESKDHPRLCGEKQSKRSGTMSRRRITPAYAGKSRHDQIFRRDPQDHPRLCGEKNDAPSIFPVY